MTMLRQNAGEAVPTKFPERVRRGAGRNPHNREAADTSGKTLKNIGLVTVKQRMQLTISDAARVLGLKEGDHLEVAIEDGRICLTPVAVIPWDEMYLLSPGWQRQMAEALEDETSGRVRKVKSGEDLIRELDEA